MPFNPPGHASLIGAMDIKGALSMAVLPSVLALVMTAVFDATGTIRHSHVYAPGTVPESADLLARLSAL